jgi:hypothetical protein
VCGTLDYWALGCLGPGGPGRHLIGAGPASLPPPPPSRPDSRPHALTLPALPPPLHLCTVAITPGRPAKPRLSCRRGESPFGRRGRGGPEDGGRRSAPWARRVQGHCHPATVGSAGGLGRGLVPPGPGRRAEDNYYSLR